MLWLFLSIFAVVVVTILTGCFPTAADRWLDYVRRWLHQQYRRRYGQAAAEQRFPLMGEDEACFESPATPALPQLYIALHGYFLRYVFGLAQPVTGVTLRRREALRLFFIGFLLRWGLGEIVPYKKKPRKG